MRKVIKKMREATFVKNNKENWLRFEEILKEPKSLPPDEVADCYLRIINDLSFARTYYRNSEITIYLNNLAQKAHFTVYKNKKEKSNRIVTFWKTELPLLFANYQKDLLLSFVIFGISALIGWFSINQDADFARLILGDAYVDMTIQNIKDGDPVAVYHEESPFLMFVAIAMNNIRVGFITFVLGILTPVGTCIILFRNGVMLGSFTGFFALYDVGLQANSIIWIHGTFEIFVIVVCGAAGLILGKSLFFPGTFTRLQSVQRGFWDGVKICFSTLPFFLFAAFLESYITRYTDMPLLLALSIIVVCATFIIFYYVIYPRKLRKKILEI